MHIKHLGIAAAAVNIAVALAAMKGDTGQHLRVGLLDADVYGPSIPQLMNLRGRPEAGIGAFRQLLCHESFFCLAIFLLRRTMTP